MTTKQDIGKQINDQLDKLADAVKDQKQSTPLAAVKAVDLHRVLSDASIFASHDATLPMLNTVHIEFAGKLMLAVATDKFRLGVSKIGPVDNTLNSGGSIDGEAVFNLTLHDVTSLIKLAKTLKRDERTRVVWINQNADSSVTFNFDDVSMDVKPADVEFPKWRQLFPDSGSQTARAATAFTADYLASFGKVNGGDSHRIVMYSHDDVHGFDPETEKHQKPTTFTIGDNFVGLLMPVKLADNGSRDYVRPAWID